MLSREPIFLEEIPSLPPMTRGTPADTPSTPQLHLDTQSPAAIVNEDAEPGQDTTNSHTCHDKAGGNGSTAAASPHSYASSHFPSHPKRKRRGFSAIHRRRRFAPSLPKFTPQLVLENNGSVARDHLASERTFLAYVRTSLALASTGVALVQFFTIAAQAGTESSPISDSVQSFAVPLGASLIAFGVTVLLIGVKRYFSTQIALTRGVFPVARISVTFITFILLSLIAVVFAVLVANKKL